MTRRNRAGGVQLQNPPRPAGERDAAFTQKSPIHQPNFGGPQKKPKNVQNDAPDLLNGDGARITHQTSLALTRGIEAAQRKAERQSEILKDYANAVDNFASRYKRVEDQEVADAIAKRVLDALLAHFYESALAPRHPLPRRTLPTQARQLPIDLSRWRTIELSLQKNVLQRKRHRSHVKTSV